MAWSRWSIVWGIVLLVCPIYGQSTCSSLQLQTMTNTLSSHASAACQSALQLLNAPMSTVLTNTTTFPTVCQTSCLGDIQNAVASLPECTAEAQTARYLGASLIQMCFAKNLTQDGNAQCTLADLTQLTAMHVQNASFECSLQYKTYPINILNDLPPTTPEEMSRFCNASACTRDLKLWANSLPDCISGTTPSKLKQAALALLTQWCAPRPPLTQNGNACTPYDGGYIDLTNREYPAWFNCTTKISRSSETKLMDILPTNSTASAEFCATPTCMANARSWSAQILNCSDENGINMRSKVILQVASYCNTPAPTNSTPSPTTSSASEHPAIEPSAVFLLTSAISLSFLK